MELLARKFVLGKRRSSSERTRRNSETVLLFLFETVRCVFLFQKYLMYREREEQSPPSYHLAKKKIELAAFFSFSFHFSYILSHLNSPHINVTEFSALEIRKWVRIHVAKRRSPLSIILYGTSGQCRTFFQVSKHNFLQGFPHPIPIHPGPFALFSMLCIAYPAFLHFQTSGNVDSHWWVIGLLLLSLLKKFCYLWHEQTNRMVICSF